MVPLVIYAYFLVYIGLGIYQPINAFFRLTKSNHLEPEYRVKLIRYLLVAMAYFIIILASYYLDFDGSWLIAYLLVLPYGFIIWYLDFTTKWNNKINLLDKDVLDNNIIC